RTPDDEPSRFRADDDVDFLFPGIFHNLVRCIAYASPLSMIVVISLKLTPFLGQSGTSDTYFFKSIITPTQFDINVLTYCLSSFVEDIFRRVSASMRLFSSLKCADSLIFQSKSSFPLYTIPFFSSIISKSSMISVIILRKVIVTPNFLDRGGACLARSIDPSSAPWMTS